MHPIIASFSALHPWPAERPKVTPNYSAGWLSTSTGELLASVLSGETRLVVELGSWLGLSTRFIADRAPNAVIIAVDHWQGSAEHRDDPRLKNLLPVLYESFLSNCWEYRARLIPLRMNTLDALDEIASSGLSPELIYLDADHAYEAVAADVRRVRALFPRAVLIGDDVEILYAAAGFLRYRTRPEMRQCGTAALCCIPVAFRECRLAALRS